MNLLLAFLSHDWTGLVLAACVLLAGGLGWRLAHRRARRRMIFASGALSVFGGLLAAGSLYHVAHMAHVRKQHPPPGNLVDVGGYRLHVLAEGEAHGRPAVVWMPGAHGAGYYFHHLHRALRDEARSILIDRAGAGWSDIGPFPRTTALEAEEVVTALRNAGEPGPYVLAGHSFGGLLMANIARRHPEQVAAVVLIDATPPDAINYAPSNPFLRKMRRDALLAAVQRLFGIHTRLAGRLFGTDKGLDAERITRLVAQRLGPALDDVRAIEDGARPNTANASLFEELAPGRLGWDAVVYDGELGDLPVYLVAPRELPELEGTSEGMARESGPDALQAREMQRLQRFYMHARERYMAVSTRTRRVVAPSGTGHNFPYESPEFVVDTMRRVLSEVAVAP